jgi:hypothetical protein
MGGGKGPLNRSPLILVLLVFAMLAVATAYRVRLDYQARKCSDEGLTRSVEKYICDRRALPPFSGCREGHRITVSETCTKGEWE